MKLTTIVDTFSNWLTTTTTAAIKALVPQAEETGREIGVAVRDGLQRGFQSGIMDGAASFATEVIEVEKLESKPKTRGRKK